MVQICNYEEGKVHKHANYAGWCFETPFEIDNGKYMTPMYKYLITSNNGEKWLR
jgi:hypothetical protein